MYPNLATNQKTISCYKKGLLVGQKDNGCDYTVNLLDKSQYERCSLNCSGQFFQGICILFKSVDCKEKIFADLSHMIILKIQVSLNKYFLLVNSDTDVYGYISSKLDKYLINSEVSIGLSSAVEDAEDLSKLIRQADMSVHEGFIDDRSNIFVFERNNLNDIKSLLENISKNIDIMNYQEIINILEKIPSIYASNRFNMKDVVFFWNQMVALILNKISAELYNDEVDFMGYTEIIDEFQNLRHLCKYLIQFFSSFNNIKSVSNGYVNKNFKELIEFVNHNFNEELNLKKLSNKYFINFTYCCELFKKITGTTFSEYVTSLRMNKACELLKNKGLSISQICTQVGYNDYYYFNRVFKKIYGVTPLNYRNSLQ